MIEQKSLDIQITNARVLYYDFFANLFLYELLEKNQEILKQQVQILEQYPLSEKSQEYFKVLQQYLEEKPQEIIQEYTQTFILSFDKKYQNIPLYLSHYQNGCMGGESLVYVRELLKESSFYVNREFTKENEDHLGILCLFMKHLLQSGDIKKANTLYKDCIMPIREGIFKILKQENAGFYTRVFGIFDDFCVLEDSLVA
ncbi:hypothetical protein CQA57_07560 [Helicobacter anseris]|uniref:Molecular chaperone TorD n=1 Tax=Helicobacter anseris TaxID=375926 RepID=A0A3D8J249_9HELI|nr:molecular chaperone TorD family protein [Helicobacter anseris]RDU71612.1 hypothetical protein CQA57_07560 [Helicobacter anseris]